jgi:putative membrane protein
MPLNLPVMNTLMAADRTLMSWTRTSLSLLSFGVPLYRILEGFQDAGGKFVVWSEVPRNAGLFLVGMGQIGRTVSPFYRN